MDSPDVGSAFAGVALVESAAEEDGDEIGGEAVGLATVFRLNANFALGALAVRAPSKSDSIDLIFCI